MLTFLILTTLLYIFRRFFYGISIQGGCPENLRVNYRISISSEVVLEVSITILLSVGVKVSHEYPLLLLILDFIIEI